MVNVWACATCQASARVTWPSWSTSAAPRKPASKAWVKKAPSMASLSWAISPVFDANISTTPLGAGVRTTLPSKRGPTVAPRPVDDVVRQASNTTTVAAAGKRAIAA